MAVRVKCHVGVDAGSGLVHTVANTSANALDVTVAVGVFAVPDVALSQKRLLSMVWGYKCAWENRTVDIHVQCLRQKLGLADCLVARHSKRRTGLPLTAFCLCLNDQTQES